MNESCAHAEAPNAFSSAMLAHEGGLHARPAIRVAQLAKRFAAKVWIGCGNFASTQAAVGTAPRISQGVVSVVIAETVTAIG